MKAPPVVGNQAVTGLRLLVQTLAMLYAVLAGAGLAMFGFAREAKTAFVIGCAIAYAVAPDKESRDTFIAFQRQRQGRDSE